MRSKACRIGLWAALAGACMAMAIAGCGGTGGGDGESGALARQASPLQQSGRWLVDADGRVVILHGVNMVAKRAPYRPSALGFGADDADAIAAMGFNTVRLGLIHKALVPAPGQYDAAYLDDIQRTAEMLTARGLLVLLDFHQDLYNERYQGEGFADWATVDSADGAPSDAAGCDQGFPTNIFTCRHLWEAFDNLFGINGAVQALSSRGLTLQQEFADAWRVVARRFRDTPGVFGYNLLNEPYPGSATLACLNPLGCLGDQDAALTAFHQQLVDAIAAIDPDKILFYEPYATNFNAGFPTAHGDLATVAGVGLSFHNYACPFGIVGIPPELGLGGLCGPLFEQSVFDNAEAQSQRYGHALLLTEFGATDDADAIDRMADLADANRVSWQYWAWWNEDVCCERPEEGIIDHPANPPSPEHLDAAKLDALVRPYPRVVAGTPLSWSFDAQTREFRLRYTSEAADGSGRRLADLTTEVWVPRRQYPDGYTISLSGARVVSGADDERLLLQASAADAPVELSIAPRTP
ncbi:MAG: cellulase family glycosylhydrolase [Nevskiales bacterium]|nr:cellulase family glycosylhydrolase [Nevskiales bacterium]